MSFFAEVLPCREKLDNWTRCPSQYDLVFFPFSYYLSRRAGFLVFSSVSRGGNFGLPVTGTRPNHSSSYGTGTRKVVVWRGKKNSHWALRWGSRSAAATLFLILNALNWVTLVGRTAVATRSVILDFWYYMCIYWCMRIPPFISFSWVIWSVILAWEGTPSSSLQDYRKNLNCVLCSWKFPSLESGPKTQQKYSPSDRKKKLSSFCSLWQVIILFFISHPPIRVPSIMVV